MAYIGIGYSGKEENALTAFFDRNREWIHGERRPRFFGSNFVILFDSNTTREIVRKLHTEFGSQEISVFTITGETKVSGRSIHVLW